MYDCRTCKGDGAHPDCNGEGCNGCDPNTGNCPTCAGAGNDLNQLLDDQLCASEFPGDDTFVGQLCERERGHDGDHEHLAVIAGTRHTRRLVWP